MPGSRCRSRSRPSSIGAGRFAALHRTPGQLQIRPEVGERAALAELGVHRVIGVFAYCIDAQGAVTAVKPLRSSRLARYDARLTAAIEAWKFAPFVVEGVATPACAGVSFVYDQT